MNAPSEPIEADRQEHAQEPEREPRRPASPPQHLASELPLLMSRLRGLAAGEVAAQRRADDAARRARQKAWRLEQLAGQIGIPRDDDLRDVVLVGQPPPTEALNAFGGFVESVQRTARRTPSVLVVGGPPGVGKSAAMAWALVRLAWDLWESVGMERAVFQVSASEVATTPRGGWGETAQSWHRWLTAPVLGIDDLGTELVNPETLSELIAERFNRALVTLATTNLNRRDFRARYPSERLHDRLDGLPWYAVARGPSLRQGRAREELLARHRRGTP